MASVPSVLSLCLFFPLVVNGLPSAFKLRHRLARGFEASVVQGPAFIFSIPLSGPTPMLNKKLNAKLLWMQFEDVLAPRLGLTVKERAVYSYLLRHSLVVGKLRLQFAVMSLARTPGLSLGAARHAVPRLDDMGVL